MCMAYEDIDSTDGSLSVHAIFRLADRFSDRLVRKEVTMQDYRIYSGVVETVNCQGDVYIYGGVVEKLFTQGQCNQYGGIIEQKVVAQQQTRRVRTQVIYKDRVVYKDRIVYRDRPTQEQKDELSKIQEKAAYFQKKCEGLEAENRELTQIVEETERQKLLREIEDLKEKLHRALQRENVAVQQRKDAEREARIAKSQVWDDFKPTKEQAKAFYKVVRICMDCETDY